MLSDYRRTLWVGGVFHIKGFAWLSAVTLAAGTTALLPAISLAAEFQSAAAAESTPSGDAQTVGDRSEQSYSHYRIERVGNQGVKLVSTNLENTYAITLLGSDTNPDTRYETPAAATAWRRSLGLDVEGKLGSVLETNLRTQFTQARSTSDGELFGLQPLDANGSNRSALGEFVFRTRVGERLAITSSRRESSLVSLGDESHDSKGANEEDQFSAQIWRSDLAGLSIDGMLTRVDANYQDLTATNTAEALQKRNKETRQLRSKLDVDRATFFVTQRASSALSPDRQGDRPRQSEIETGVSLRLTDLRDGIGLPIIFLLPDSAWISSDHGSITHDAGLSAQPGALTKSALGLTRNWGAASVNLSYWDSVVQSRTALAEEAQWRAHGMDVAGDIYSKRWSLSGNVSWYRAGNTALRLNSAEGSVNGSLFLTWHPSHGPKLSAGVTNYSYQADFFDYNGAEQCRLIRYQLALDFSPVLASAWFDKETQLTMLASFQGSKTGSQWSQVGYNSDEGNLFVALKLARPFLY